MDPERRYNPQETWNTIVYAFVLKVPATYDLELASVKPSAKVRTVWFGRRLGVGNKSTKQNS